MPRMTVAQLLERVKALEDVVAELKGEVDGITGKGPRVPFPPPPLPPPPPPAETGEES